MIHVRELSCSVVPDSFATPWTVALQTPLSLGFSRQEYCSGLPFPPPGDLPNSETESTSPVALAFQAGSLPLSHQGSTSPHIVVHMFLVLRRTENSPPDLEHFIHLIL